MNYIIELREFYNWLETNELNAGEINLWQALMYIANKTRWEESFTVTADTLRAKTGLSQKALYEARERLVEKGRIQYQEETENKSATYTIIPLCGNTSCEPKPQNKTVEAEVEAVPNEITESEIETKCDEHSSQLEESEMVQQTQKQDPTLPQSPTQEKPIFKPQTQSPTQPPTQTPTNSKHIHKHNNNIINKYNINNNIYIIAPPYNPPEGNCTGVGDKRRQIAGQKIKCSGFVSYAQNGISPMAGEPPNSKSLQKPAHDRQSSNAPFGFFGEDCALLGDTSTQNDVQLQRCRDSTKPPDYGLPKAFYDLPGDNYTPPNHGYSSSTSPPDIGFTELICALPRDDITEQNPTLGARHRVLIS